MSEKIKLRGIGWDHERCMAPLISSVDSYTKTAPNLEITWETRSLAHFGEGRLEELVENYDLIVFDHPYCGEIAEKGWLVNFRDYLSDEQLKAYEQDSLGPSWESYQAQGGTWALPIDAAAQVSVYRPDLLHKLGFERAPTTIKDVIELGKLAREQNMWIALPTTPIDAICTFLTIAANIGIPVSRDKSFFPAKSQCISILNNIKALAEISYPDAINWNPINCFNHMSEFDDLCYVPYAFGYTNYSRENCAKPLQFCDIPGVDSGSCAGALIGGAGIGVSQKSSHLEESVQYANYLCSPRYQAGEYFENGGQPASRYAWLSPRTNKASMNFFARTFKTLESAYLRPNYDGYINHFRLAGAKIHQFLNEELDVETLSDWLIDDYYHGTL